MGDIRAAFGKHPGLRTAAWVVVLIVVAAGVLHVISLSASISGGAYRGTLHLGNLHTGLGKLHARVSRNSSGGAPYARTTAASQDIAGPAGSVKDEPFSGTVIPTPPSSWPVMPYPADYAAVDD